VLEPEIPRAWRSLLQRPLALASAVVVLGMAAWWLWRSNAPGTGIGEEKLASAPGSPVATQVADPSPGLAAPSIPAQETGGSRRKPVAGTWTLRGRVTHDDLHGAPAAPVVGRLFEGVGPGARMVREERFQADANGEFAWSPALPAGFFSVQI